MLERQGIYMNHKNSVDFIVKRSCKFASVAGVNGPKVHVDQWFYRIGLMNDGAWTLSVMPSQMAVDSEFWPSLMITTVSV